MKISRTGVWLLSGFVLAGAVAWIALRQGEIATQRAEHDSLAKDSAEAQRLARENQGGGAVLVDKAELEKLRETNADLPRLRGEVTRLRQQAAQLDALRGENVSLTAQLTNTASPSRPINQLPDFVVLATPEATVQTFLWSTTAGNLERVKQCFADALPDGMQDGTNLESVRKDMLEQTKDFEGFRIVGRKDISPDEVIVAVTVVGMNTPTREETEPMPLRRTNGEWKLSVKGF